MVISLCIHSVVILLLYLMAKYSTQILRKELENTGYIFKSNNSDTEIIVAGFSLYGKNFINKLNGMFAFLIYQISKSKIYLIRDQIGIKPLYYKLVNREIAISSEINFLKDFVTSSKISNISTVYFLSFGHYQMGKQFMKIFIKYLQVQ